MKAKMTSVKAMSRSGSAPILVIFPGGPGLSSKTMESLEALRQNFDLIFLDFGGTLGTEAPHGMTYEAVIESIENELRLIRQSVILVGHSYGGVLASEIAVRGKITVLGLVCIGTPFSSATLKFADDQYRSNKTPALLAAESLRNTDPTNENFKKWMAEQAFLFFVPETLEEGRRLILEDDVSAPLFAALRAHTLKREVLKQLAGLKIKKLALGGENDRVIPSDLFKQDAHDLGFDFRVIKNAGHFVHFDQPGAVARMIEQSFSDGLKG